MKIKLLLTALFGISIFIFSSWSRVSSTMSITEHHLQIDGQVIDYIATAGSMRINDEDSKRAANIFYAAYVKKEPDAAPRPITFVFNGGPGSASVWLHMGSFGPARVKFKNNKGDSPQSDFKYDDNPYSWLSFTDLVFVDPVSTGYSRAAKGVNPKQFYGYDADINSIAKFISGYLDNNHRQNSPLFIAGESYGAARAVGLTDYLQTQLQLKVNGITLISPALNYQLLNFKPENTQPLIHYLPTYALTAQYHHKLRAELQKLSPEELYNKALYFADHSFTAYLNPKEANTKSQNLISDSLQYYTGLPRDLINAAKGKITDNLFMRNLLGNKSLVVGCFDSRFTGPSQKSGYIDPSETNVRRLFLSAFDTYIHHNLDYQTDIPYQATITLPWNYASGAINGYLNVSQTLKKVMLGNPSLRVNVVCGYYDLSTPVSSTRQVIRDLQLSPVLQNNITMSYYASGHMIYISNNENAKFKTDSQKFYQHALTVTTLQQLASVN